MFLLVKIQLVLDTRVAYAYTHARITCGAVRRLATTAEKKLYLPMAVIAFSDRCFYVLCYVSFVLSEQISATKPFLEPSMDSILFR